VRCRVILLYILYILTPYACIDPHSYRQTKPLTALAALLVILECMCRIPTFVASSTAEHPKTFPALKFLSENPVALNSFHWRFKLIQIDRAL
jgi:hypothetical protein